MLRVNDSTEVEINPAQICSIEWYREPMEKARVTLSNGASHTITLKESLEALKKPSGAGRRKSN